MNGIQEKQMTKGPRFGSEGVCNPVKELHTKKIPNKEKQMLWKVLLWGTDRDGSRKGILKSAKRGKGTRHKHQNKKAQVRYLSYDKTGIRILKIKIKDQ